MAIKKKFFEVEIPLTNSSAELLAYNIQDLNNRTIKLDLTRQLRGKSIEVVFKIKTEKEKAVAEPIKLNLLPFFIRRMLRRNISYVEDSFATDCEDASLRVKTFLITRKKVSRKVRKALREETKEWLIDYIKNKSYKEVFSDIIGNRIQKPLSLKLKKIYPLALCEIRMLNIETFKEQEKLKITTEKVKTKEEKEDEKKAEESEEKASESKRTGLVSEKEEVEEEPEEETKEAKEE